ncbi:hypothetical protein PTKIN_Ptkin14bG0009000 [Pterospermum kingtungense]
MPGPSSLTGTLYFHRSTVIKYGGCLFVLYCGLCGFEIIRFSKSIGVTESNFAEILAIREAFILFVSSPWVNCRNLVIESDFKNTISWVCNSSVPWRVMNIVNHIDNLKRQVKNWRISMCSEKATKWLMVWQRKGSIVVLI